MIILLSKAGENYIYALKGGNDPPGGDVPGDNFWRYSISNNEWEILPNIPAGVGVNNGRRLGIANGNIYCWRGSYGDGTLWVYGLVGAPEPEETVGPSQPEETPWVYVGAVGAAVAIVIVILALVKFKLLKPKKRKAR